MCRYVYRCYIGLFVVAGGLCDIGIQSASGIKLDGLSEEFLFFCVNGDCKLTNGRNFLLKTSKFGLPSILAEAMCEHS